MRLTSFLIFCLAAFTAFASELRPAKWKAGEEVGRNYPADGEWFAVTEISDSLFATMSGVSFPAQGCPVSRDDLRAIEALHRDSSGRRLMGLLIVNKAIADDVCEALRELYRKGYPIELMVPIDNFGGDDIASMEANNTSAFNCRPIAGSSRLSNHAYGLAIDINPLYNPWMKNRSGRAPAVSPESGRPWLDRTLPNPYIIRRGGKCWEAFVSRGFTWGGAWTSIKDYQHFERKR